MGFAETFKVIGWVTDRIDQVAKWLKQKGRRDSIQGMEKDVAGDDNTAINKRLSDLAKKAKDRDDAK